MKIKIKNTQLAMAMSILLFGLSSVAKAAEDEAISVHGYGDVAMRRAVDNNYTKTHNGTQWDYNYVAVNITAKVDEKTKIVAQIRKGDEIAQDFAVYLNYNATDNLTARAGQIRTPIGLFNEIRDIRFLQLSALTPLVYQDAAGFLPDIFKGYEAVYHLDMGAHRLTFDAYGGEPAGANAYGNMGPTGTFSGNALAPDYRYALVQNIYGGRITYKAPIGLKLALSLFQNDLLATVSPTPPTSAAIPDRYTRRMTAVSLDYRKYGYDIKMEYLAMAQFVGTPFENRGRGYYGQMGYTIAEKYTPYARYDYILYHDSFRGNPNLEQKVKVLGINYKLNNNVSLRMENHWNTGYAILANSPGVEIRPTTLNWNVFVLGINVIF